MTPLGVLSQHEPAVFVMSRLHNSPHKHERVLKQRFNVALLYLVLTIFASVSRIPLKVVGSATKLFKPVYRLRVVCEPHSYDIAMSIVLSR
jgi:hypothetical protein